MIRKILFLLLILKTHDASCQNYVIDTSFGINGAIWYDSIAGYNVARDAAGNFYLAGEKQIVANYGLAFGVMKLQSGGNRDSSFGINGIASFDLGFPLQEFRGVTLQPDGKIVCVGSYYYPPSSEGLIARFTPGGQLDTSFNGTGYAVFDGNNENDNFTRVVVQPDGKLVVGGNSCFGGMYKDKLAACRYNANGTIDSTFANNGFYRHVTDGWVTKIVLDGNKIVLAGGLGNTEHDYCIVRLNADGTPDSSFAANGTFVYPKLGENAIIDILQDGTGYLGVTYNVAGNPNWNDAQTEFLRITQSGEIDTTVFGGGIFTFVAPTGYSTAPAQCIKSGNTLIAAGSGFVTGASNAMDGVFFQVNIANGTVITSNGANGIVTYSVAGQNETFAFIDEEPNGDLVLTGYHYLPGRKSFITRYINQPTAIVELPAKKKSVLVYPNPGSGIVTIESITNIEQLNVLDMYGKSITQFNNPIGKNFKVQIDVANYAGGIYLVRILTDGMWQSIKLVVK